jgi:hypothetical protein
MQAAVHPGALATGNRQRKKETNKQTNKPLTIRKHSGISSLKAEEVVKFFVF